jgi:hypothetical protein
MRIKDDFTEIRELVAPYKFREYPNKATKRDFQQYIDRLLSVIIGMIVANRYTEEQLKQIVKTLKVGRH